MPNNEPRELNWEKSAWNILFRFRTWATSPSLPPQPRNALETNTQGPPKPKRGEARDGREIKTRKIAVCPQNRNAQDEDNVPEKPKREGTGFSFEATTRGMRTTPPKPKRGSARYAPETKEGGEEGLTPPKPKRGRARDGPD